MIDDNIEVKSLKCSLGLPCTQPGAAKPPMFKRDSQHDTFSAQYFPKLVDK